jgi:hypothetical protein
MNRTELTMLHNPFKPWLAVLLVTGLALTIADLASAADEAARVVGVRGSALAHSPGEAPRALTFDAAIFAGDKIITAQGAGVGLLAGEHYVGLDEATTAVIGLTEQGAPSVIVENGRARVLASGTGAPARIGTATLMAANGGTDTDVFAFAEKAGLVAMVCSNETPVEAARAGEALTPGKGRCAVAKRGEPLYLADAAHPPLELIADNGLYDVAGDPNARIPSPLPPVALGLAPDPIFASSVDPLVGDPRNPCDSPAACQAGSLAVIPSPMPPAPPINPPVPGTPPL